MVAGFCCPSDRDKRSSLRSAGQPVSSIRKLWVPSRDSTSKYKNETTPPKKRGGREIALSMIKGPAFNLSWTPRIYHRTHTVEELMSTSSIHLSMCVVCPCLLCPYSNMHTYCSHTKLSRLNPRNTHNLVKRIKVFYIIQRGL